MDIISISSAYSSLKEAVTIIKNLSKIKSDAELAEKTIQLSMIISAVQNDLFETQSAYSSAISKINDLESKLKAFEDWTIEKQRYELFKFASSGSFVYRLKESESHIEPIHDICPNCYNRAIKSILQSAGYHDITPQCICPNCKSIFISEEVIPPTISFSFGSMP